VDHKAEIAKIAAMAGMSQAAFDAAWADDDLARAILAQRQEGERQFNIQATPTFVFGTRVVSGAIGFDRFAREAQA
jgi:protein-disulfide isomerase